MTEDPAEDGREKRGTFLVTHVDETSAVLRDVHDAEVLTLRDPPDLTTHEVVEATVRAEPPMEVTWAVQTLDERRTIDVAESPESPTALAEDLAADQEVGDLARQERAGKGELHVLSVPPEQTAAAVSDVLEDEETVARAARLGVGRVEVRSAEGIVSVRYLP